MNISYRKFSKKLYKTNLHGRNLLPHVGRLFMEHIVVFKSKDRGCLAVFGKIYDDSQDNIRLEILYYKPLDHYSDIIAVLDRYLVNDLNIDLDNLSSWKGTHATLLQKIQS